MAKGAAAQPHGTAASVPQGDLLPETLQIFLRHVKDPKGEQAAPQDNPSFAVPPLLGGSI